VKGGAPTAARLLSNLAFAEMLSRLPRTPRIIAQEIVVVGAALGCVLLSHPTGFPWSETAALVACCALPLRLKWPWLAMLFCLWGLAGELGLAPALIGLYRIGRTSKSPWVTIAWATAAVLTVEITVFAMVPMEPRDATLSILFTILWMVSPSALGLLVTTRQRLAASLAELRTAREAELEIRADRARAAERAKIGREIHDAVGHHATLIAVEAAALEATTAEQETREVAGRVRALARESLAEMRTALGLVGERSEAGSGLTDVEGLIQQARQAGMTVHFEATPADVHVLPAVGRAVFRIIQECLTNAAKHAPGAPVTVMMGEDRGTLKITVTSGPATLPPPAVTLGGQGLTGMAERASTVGGHLEVDRKPAGLFTVRAHLPLESYGTSKVDATEPTIDGTEAALDPR
jgi:signal transduction histidine kinase